MIDKERAMRLSDRLLRSRMRLLQSHGFFGLLLMHCKFAVDETCGTAATDGERIYFGLDFAESLSDSELDIVMLHEVMHIVLNHCFRGASVLDRDAFNVACDIVINSGIMYELGRTTPITLSKFGILMHKTPKGDEGRLYTAEQVYDMFPHKRKSGGGGGTGNWKGGGILGGGQAFKDDHSKWGTLFENDYLKDKWKANIYSAAITAEAFANSGGLSKEISDRLLKELRQPQLDWRTILNSFVQVEITDYSWSPPDRRFDGSGFFLPDYNETEQVVKDILFMIDTSASMNDEQVAAVFSEVKGSIEQFNGRLYGKLGFFSGKAIPPVDFDSVESLLKIMPQGKGGTNFHCIFDYVNSQMEINPPSCIIILTDGYAAFPPEAMANGIPVLWLLNNTNINPPWGKIARITNALN